MAMAEQATAMRLDYHQMREVRASFIVGVRKQLRRSFFGVAGPVRLAAISGLETGYEQLSKYS
jgi:hypothetical protein